MYGVFTATALSTRDVSPDGVRGGDLHPGAGIDVLSRSGGTSSTPSEAKIC